MLSIFAIRWLRLSKSQLLNKNTKKSLTGFIVIDKLTYSMNNDQKIDEILKTVREERELNNNRFAEMQDEIHTSLTELKKDMQTEREVNNHRFNQLVASMTELKTEMRSATGELKEQLQTFYKTLSEDIQVFAIDLEKVQKRVGKLDRKIA